MKPAVHSVVETALYVEDLGRSQDFYQRVLGLFTVDDDSSRMRALGVPGQQLLLLFKRGASRDGAQIPSGFVPGHDASGHQHVAFAIAKDELPAWQHHLEECGIAIESVVTWPRGGTSLYFRDPDGHSLELVTPGCWKNY